MYRMLLLRNKEEIDNFMDSYINIALKPERGLNVKKCMDIFWEEEREDYENRVFLCSQPTKNLMIENWDSIIGLSDYKVPLQLHVIKEFEDTLFSDDQFLEAVKKDILCLIMLTCDYWKYDATLEKKEWYKYDFDEYDYKTLLIKLDIMTGENTSNIRTTKYLWQLKEYILKNPILWKAQNKKIRSTHYGLGKVITNDFKNLSQEEIYAYQYISGYPIAIELLLNKSNKEDEKDTKFIANICNIDGVNLRQYFVDMYVSGEEIQILKLFEEDIESTGVVGDIIQEILLSFARTFLKIAMLTYSEQKSDIIFRPQNIISAVKRDYGLSSIDNCKNFWGIGEYEDKIKAIGCKVTGDPRNKMNVRYLGLQKMILYKIQLHMDSNKLARAINYTRCYAFPEFVPCKRNVRD